MILTMGQCQSFVPTTAWRNKCCCWKFLTDNVKIKARSHFGQLIKITKVTNVGGRVQTENYQTVTRHFPAY